MKLPDSLRSLSKNPLSATPRLIAFFLNQGQNPPCVIPTQIFSALRPCDEIRPQRSCQRASGVQGADVASSHHFFSHLPHHNHPYNPTVFRCWGKNLWTSLLALPCVFLLLPLNSSTMHSRSISGPLYDNTIDQMDTAGNRDGHFPVGAWQVLAGHRE